MMRAKSYSPQLSRELVSRLYHKAKAERIPMTKLANRFIERALGSSESIGTLASNDNKTDHESA